MTLPVSIGEAVLGKFLAAWLFTGIALALTFQVWITINYLGEADNPVILLSYIGSFLMAGAYLAVGACVSAFTRNQVIAFVISFVICLIFVLAGFPMVMDVFQGWAPQALINAINNMSFLSHYESIARGVIDLRDLIFFFSFIGCWLLANAIVVEIKKSD